MVKDHSDSERGERLMFYLTTHSTHFIYGYMASDIWLRTILIVRKETRCRHIGYSYRLAARVLLYAPSHRQGNIYHSLCYTSRGALAGMVREETRCRHMGYSFRLTARVLLYAPSHRQDSTYHSLCYTSHGDLAGTRNSNIRKTPWIFYMILLTCLRKILTKSLQQEQSDIGPWLCKTWHGRSKEWLTVWLLFEIRTIQAIFSCGSKIKQT